MSDKQSMYVTGAPIIVPNPDGSPTRFRPDAPPMFVTDVRGGTITLSTEPPR